MVPRAVCQARRPASARAGQWCSTRAGLASPCRQIDCSTSTSGCFTYIKEKIFYPQLLQRGVDDPVGETLDAVGDHNDIRDGVRAADAAVVGTDQWWAAVGRAREANDDHMAEEEREGLSDFRRHAPLGLREALAQQYSEFMTTHPTTKGLLIADRDPQTYVDDARSRNKSRQRTKDTSLGIGSLKGK